MAPPLTPARRRLAQLHIQLNPQSAAVESEVVASVVVEPPLLTTDSGAAVTAETWRQRRAELWEAIVPHEFGGMPPAPEKLEGGVSGAEAETSPPPPVEQAVEAGDG